ncbi:hypothetical protein P691DRAFT_772397 [Macrolepiota fuliginosa MF-IS2]|uniref:Mechanosensitive ion channel protein n=1 Tax=Macrolepiota fuliginosa MF-IS2 TaxID=1400762 RepID=A0A9P6C8R7_9AGAR|nr:hypothetical protein P691DRAFT_772397 [Macrolepiota fuliginosa MF-IS2]
MSNQVQPRRPHVTSENDDSLPDLEKGHPGHVTEFSEDEKGHNHANVRLDSKYEPETEDKNTDIRAGGVRKHWRPGGGWFVLVFIGLGACWIPAILGWTKFRGARVWGVKLLFWSIWLSILWAGWWFALVFSWVWHRVLLVFVHVLRFYAVKRYVNWLEYLHGYLALVAWTAALWITWVPLIADRQMGGEDPNSRSVRAINLGGRLFFALACCTAILLAEKVSVQWIALKFHERSYRRRIEVQKEAVQAFKVLFALFGRAPNAERKQSQKRRFATTWSDTLYFPLSSDQRFNYHHRFVDRGPTSKLRTALTDVTGQIFEESKVAEDDAVGKAFHRDGPDGSRKMRQLAEDIWRGLSGRSTQTNTSTPFALQKFVIESKLSGTDKGSIPKHCQGVTVDQIWKVLTGGLSHLESIPEAEFLTRCSDLHAEQRRLEETMNDLQNVVGRLDDLLMLFWVVTSILIFSVALEAELKTLIFGAGSAFVGASWLLKDSAAEILASILFLFSKHPFDVEDKVIINGKRYTVVEMRLLSTVFYDDDSVQVQAPNSLLNTMFIHNLRRSPATSEPFSIEVSHHTTEKQLEDFESRMTKFLKTKPKDYRDDFHVVIKELSFQDQKLVLNLEIKYNNNWESDIHVRARRRNAWICAVRKSLDEGGIHGPGTPGLRVTTATDGEDDV